MTFKYDSSTVIQSKQIVRKAWIFMCVICDPKQVLESRAKHFKRVTIFSKFGIFQKNEGKADIGWWFPLSPNSRNKKNKKLKIKKIATILINFKQFYFQKICYTEKSPEAKLFLLNRYWKSSYSIFQYLVRKICWKNTFLKSLRNFRK